MLRFKDYIFYRMYLKYLRNGEFGTLTAVTFMAIVETSLSIPLIVLSNEIVPVNNNWKYAPTTITLIIMFILNCKRYYKKGRVIEIIKTYKHSKYNKIFPDWTMVLVAFGYIITGFACIKPVLLFWRYITSLFA
ncbi:MAG: hypothetical protein RL662_2226 [Bacteroidota bacterium]|jgi:hypothetical protein